MFDIDPAWLYIVLVVIATYFAYMFGRIRERLRWIRLLKNPPDPKDQAWFEKRIAEPFRSRSDGDAAKEGHQ